LDNLVLLDKFEEYDVCLFLTQKILIQGVQLVA
jgi:hypothetical protein